MGRIVFGVCLLVCVLVLGLFVMFAMDNINTPISQMLEDAAEVALNGDLQQGIALANKARSTWKNRWHTIASFADHSPMDEIDSLFAQMEVYGQTGNIEDFASHCSRLSMLVSAVGDAHSLNWWNLL